MSSLLDPKAVAVVGASQRQSRGTSVLMNSSRRASKAKSSPSIRATRTFTAAAFRRLPRCQHRSTTSRSRSRPYGMRRFEETRPEYARGGDGSRFRRGGHGERAMRSIAGKGMRICGPIASG
jgi:hypothetical protein